MLRALIYLMMYLITVLAYAIILNEFRIRDLEPLAGWSTQEIVFASAAAGVTTMIPVFLSGSSRSARR